MMKVPVMRRWRTRGLGSAYVTLAYLSAVAYVVFSEALHNYFLRFLPASIGKVLVRLGG
jgi:hypothetical protein